MKYVNNKWTIKSLIRNVVERCSFSVKKNN
jgi:hypothetical protein